LRHELAADPPRRRRRWQPGLVGPLLFALAMFLSHPAVMAERWHAGGFILTVHHFHWLVAVMLVSDVLFVLRHRLMTTSGGF
jgi:hypothetical protein